MNNIRLRTLTTALSLALIFGALLPSAALADGETPPPPDSGTTEVSAAEEPAPTEVAPTDTAPVDENAVTATLEESTVTEPTATEVATEVAPTDSWLVDASADTTGLEESLTAEPTATEVATEVAPAEGESTEIAPVDGELDTTADLLAELPEGTDLVVVNAEGEPVPLASEEGSEILVAGDPIWCPSGVAPKPGVGGCSPTQTSMSNLIAYYPSGFPSNGVIWVEDGTTVDAGVTIDGSGPWLGAAGYSLTVQGGWNGVAGSAALDPVDPYTYFDGTNTDWLSIINWIGPVSLKNLVFNSATYSKTTDYSTLLIETAGNIALDKVQVNNALNIYCFPQLGSPCVPLKAGGATLDNRSGTGIVTLTNSSFNNNDGAGLVILSKNAVALKNVFVYNNDNGCSSICSFSPITATIDNTYAATAKSVTISNSEFSGNSGLGSTGLSIFSNGTVALNNIVANSNSYEGIFIKNDSLGAYPVYVNGVNNFSSNGGSGLGSGLHVESNGAIILSKTTANFNGGDGVHLDNPGAAGYQPVTIAGFFTAIGNSWDGLEIKSRGNVTAAYLTANDNGGSGVYIDNGSSSDSPRPVLITGKNNFNNNDNYGLFIESKGAITVYNVTATYNGVAALQRGVQLDNQSANPALQQPVTLYGVNLISNNGARGLSIQSFGLATVNNLTALNNGFSGVIIENSGGTYPKNVLVKGTNVFNNNGVYGLYVISNGAITVSNITASRNKEGGAYLDNCSWSGGFCNGTLQSNVTFTGYGVFEYNGKLNGAHAGAAGTNQVGLEIRSRGTITLNNISANHNYGSGAEITTAGLTTVHSVTLYGINTFNNNGDSSGFYNSGLGINADGAIKVNKLTATDNYVFGAWLNNRVAATSQQPITVSGYSYLTGNVSYGMFVISYGTVTLSNVTSLNNVSGLYLQNSGGTYPRSVLISGINTFSSNRGWGIYMLSDGAITLSNITASKNKEGGAYLDNCSWNGSSCTGTFQSNVTITGYGVFENNGRLNGDHAGAAGVTQVGLMIKSHGAIALTNIGANHNYGSGAEITTVGITTMHSVVMYGINTFNNNGDSSGSYNSGLNVDADGAITVNKLTASDNYSNGALLNNQHNTTLHPAVAVNGFSFITGNGWDGLIVWSYGVVTLNNVTSLSNAGSGVWIDNNGGTYPRAVTIKGTNVFNNNYPYNGLTLISDGIVTLSNVTASRNQGVGVWLDNCGWNGASCIGTAQSNVVITGYGLFEYNGKLNGDPGGAAGSTQAGLAIHSRGAVTLANITANHNYGTGADIYTIGITAPKAVVLTGTNTFTFNGDADQESGLVVNADGNITISNVTASYNYYDGAKLNNYANWAAPAPENRFATFGSITITGFGYFVGNQHYAGLEAATHGSITLNRVVADKNGSGGVGGGLALSAEGNITLVCSSAYGNEYVNLYAYAAGTLTLKGFMSYGAVLGNPDDLTYSTLVTSTCS